MPTDRGQSKVPLISNGFQTENYQKVKRAYIYTYFYVLTCRCTVSLAFGIVLHIKDAVSVSLGNTRAFITRKEQLNLKNQARYDFYNLMFWIQDRSSVLRLPPC